MIRPCTETDFSTIHAIINDAAVAYRGVIPVDCWHEPYMSEAVLEEEIRSGVRFWGWDQNGVLIGVMGIQDVKDVTLIRHAYVRTLQRNLGIGALLLTHLRTLTQRPLLIGTWAAADWAIRFYVKHGFRVVANQEKIRLLQEYWTIPDRQVETSVVLAEDRGASGTHSSMSLTGTFQLILHKKATLAGTTLEALEYPLLETQDDWLIHGYSYANYLAELGPNAQSEIYSKSSVDLALRDAFRKVRHFLMTTQGLTEDEAISLITVGVDFGITQVVDGNWGVHAIVKKALFAGRSDF